MSGIVLNDGAALANYEKPYFVAEVNSSHNGNVDVARQMIDAAADAGCDCVKFQSWSAKSLYSRTYYKKNPIAERFVKKLSLTPAQLKEMADHCASRGVSFSSTPYSEEEVDFLTEDCHVPFIKIASMEINNLGFLRYIGAKKHPVCAVYGHGRDGRSGKSSTYAGGNRKPPNCTATLCVNLSR